MAKVLIVDDERSIRETLREFIKELGHEVFTAPDAPEAIETIERSLPDVVVCDIVLPGADGISVLEHIHRTSSDTQVIMITGEPTVETAADAVRQTAFDYLAKPVSREDIQDVVARALLTKQTKDAERQRAEDSARYREHLEEEVDRKGRALEASQEDYRLLIENANEAVFVTQDGRVKLANPKTEEISGYSLDVLSSMSLTELIHPEDLEMTLEYSRRRRTGEEVPSVYVFRMLDADGETRWIEIRPVIIEWEGSRATLNFASDITARARAEQALEESQARYRSLFENSPISLWQQDYSQTKATLDRLKSEGVDDLEAYLRAHPEFVEQCLRQVRVVDVNRATVELHAATSKTELLGHLSDIIPPEARDRFIEQLLAIARGDTSYEGSSSDRRLDGSPMQADVRWIAAPGYEESLARVLVSKVDITARVEAEAALQAALDGTVRAIGLTTEMRDPYTAGHQRRATELAVAIAAELGLSDEATDGLRAAGLMHDIGKLAVPAEILSKPSALTEVEMSLIRAHPTSAYDILKTVTFPWPVAKIVLQHHERLDGSGYPQGLRGSEIELEARILCVADVIEAMASHRPYRAALGIDIALEEIETHRGIRYDPDVVDACVRLFREKDFAFSVDEGMQI